MPYTPPVRRGLIRRTKTNWSGDPDGESLDEIAIYDVPFDNVKFSGSGNPYWSQRGTYEDRRDFEGFALHYVSRDPANREMEPKKGYTVHLLYVGYFRDLDDYYRFIRESMRSTIIEELWEDVPAKAT